MQTRLMELAEDFVREIRDELISELRGNASEPKVAAPRGNGPAKRKPRAPKLDIGEAILAYVKANPKCSSEQIREALGIDSKTLSTPLYALVGEKSLRKTGQKRGTRYSVA